MEQITRNNTPALLFFALAVKITYENIDVDSEGSHITPVIEL